MPSILNLQSRMLPNTWDLFIKLPTGIATWMFKYISNSAKSKLNSYCAPNPASLPHTQPPGSLMIPSPPSICSGQTFWVFFFLWPTSNLPENPVCFLFKIYSESECFPQFLLLLLLSIASSYLGESIGLLTELLALLPNPTKSRQSIADKASFYYVGQIA